MSDEDPKQNIEINTLIMQLDDFIESLKGSEPVDDFEVSEINDLVNSVPYDTVLKIVSYFDAGQVDIRLISSYLFCSFSLTNLSALPTILKYWHKIISPQKRAVIQPESDKDRKFRLAFKNYFLGKVIKKIKNIVNLAISSSQELDEAEQLNLERYNEERSITIKDPWQVWCAQNEGVDFELILEESKILEDHDYIQTMNLTKEWKLLQKYIEDVQAYFLLKKEHDSKKDTKNDNVTDSTTSSAQSATVVHTETQISNKSEALQHLEKKMQLFEDLVRSGKFLKACIIYMDISNLLEKNEKLLVFFPDIFCNFLQTSCEYSSKFRLKKESLEENSDLKDMLHNLYLTSLDAFKQIKEPVLNIED